MTYVMRDNNGAIVAISRLDHDALPGNKHQWSRVDDDSAELATFMAQHAAYDATIERGGADTLAESSLASTDLGMVRVLEDLIDLLIDRGVIVFTDLPLEAQRKLSERQSRRAKLRRMSLLDDESDLI